jgi:hypothetical protein
MVHMYKPELNIILKRIELIKIKKKSCHRNWLTTRVD